MNLKLVFLPIVVLLFSILSCSEYNKVLKSEDLTLKYDKAIQYYEEDEYAKAYPLLEESITIYRGTSKAEKLYYYFAYSDYYLGDFFLASHRFKNFKKMYPTSKHAEECHFMSAYCHYLNSPNYSLDQNDTKQAISELQSFVNQYPESQLLDSCNTLVDELRGKLEKKSFEIAKQYYHTRDYKSAIKAFENCLVDFPDTDYKEEVLYLAVKANYDLAANSIDSKKAERYDATIKSYVKFVDSFPNSKRIKELETVYESAVKGKSKV